MTLCEEGEWFFPDFEWPDLDGTQGASMGELVEGALSQLPSNVCWPSHLEQDPPIGMPTCQAE
jgi:hypothetical protein